MLQRLNRFSCALSIVLLLSCLGGPFVRRASPQQMGNVFLPAPRTFRQHLTRARKALAEERYGDAVLELGSLLARSPTDPDEFGEGPQDFFMVAADASGAQTSLKSEAQRLLGSMPRQGLELYELQFGADARALLDEAVHTTDFGKLNEVVRKYFHTQAGYEATVLLGRLHLDRGQPLAAALCFQRVIDAPAAAAQYDPELSVLLAACWFYAGRTQRAVDTLAPLQQRFPRALMRIGEFETGALPDAEGTLAWLQKHFPLAPTAERGASEWLVHRGDPTRNAASEGGMPLTSFRWRAPTATDPTDEALIREIQSSNHNQGVSGVPSLSPLAVDDVIVMRTPDRVLAIDFETGKRIWEYPWWDSSYPTVTVTRRGGTHNQEIERRKEQLRQRIWYDAPYGQVSSDGGSVYLLDDLRFAQSRSSFSPWLPPGRARRGSPQWPQQHNQLVALDLGRQGSLKWMIGGDSGLDEPKLAGAFFLGPPLPLMGQLYALAEINGEIRLLALDKETGSQQWSQQLAHVDTLTILNNQRRRLAGASPSYGDGVLVCPTSAGAVVAIDLASRSLLWGYQYAPVVQERHRFGIQNRFPRQSPSGNRWIDATVTIADGAVVLTPVESNKLFCLDLLTGTPRWSLEPRTERADLQQVACVYDRQLILIGKHQIGALRMSDGKPAWEAPVTLNEADGEMPSGRGFQSGRYYFVPTTTSQLLKIDLTLGKIVERSVTDRVLGNLLCYQDEVISQGSDFLTTFYQIKPLRRLVAERLQNSPKDAWALARQGELLIHDGRLQQALDALRQAYELQGDNVAVRALLVKTLLTALREDFVEHQELAVELEKLIDRPGQRLEYLRLMATGLHATGKLALAADKYLELADLITAEIEDEELDAVATVPIDEYGSARLDRWLNARLAALFEAADGSVRSRLDQEVHDRWLRIAGGSARQLQKFLAFFDFHPLATTARIELAEQLAVSDRWLEAEMLISQLARQSSHGDAVTAAARVAARLNDLGKYDLAADFYRMLSRRWPDTPGAAGRTGDQLLAAARTAGPLREALKEPPNWKWGRTRESTTAARSDQIYRRVIPIPIRRSSAAAGEFSAAFDGGSNGSIFVRDGQGKVVSRAALSDGRVYYQDLFGVNYAELNGHLLVAVLADNVIAMDMFRGARGEEDVLLWRDRFAQPVSEAGRQVSKKGVEDRSNPFDLLAHPKVFFVSDSGGQPVGTLGPVNTHGVVFLKSRTLVSVDPTTGQQLWDRKNMARGAEVFGDEKYVFVAARNDSVATVLSAVDGSLVGTRRVPVSQQRWTTNGRLILAWERSGESLRLFLYDAWSESEVWSDSFARGARGTLAEGLVAVMEPGGRFCLRSLQSDSVEVEAQLEPEERLGAIYLMPSRRQYLLMTDRPKDGDSKMNFTPIGGGLPAPLVTGCLYAFARPSGKQLWQSPARIEEFGLPVSQPGELPTLWFLRQVSTRRSRSSAGQSDRTSVLCLDRRDGRMLFASDDISTRTTSYAISADIDRQTVRLLLPRTTLNLQFTDEPMPPAPPAQMDDSSP